MRKIIQVNFVILIFAVFIVVYRQAFMQRYDKFYYEEGKIILKGDSKEDKYINNKHLFFYEAKGIHQNKPLYQFENELVKIDIYEISYPDHSKSDIHKVVTYLMPIITFADGVYGNPNLTYGIHFQREDNNQDLDLETEEVYWFEIINFLNLDIYMLDTGYGEIIPTITDEDEDLILINPVKIEVFTAESVTENGVTTLMMDKLLSMPFSINENSFKVRNELINLFHEKEANGQPLNITEEDILNLKEEKEVLFTVIHNASKYNNILYSWFIGYFLITIVLSYFVFYYKRNNKLGNIKPPKALLRSIEETEKRN